MAARRVIALAGNPNVGKSTLFNRLTGMNQHTGNWPGKTVAVASGRCESGGFELVDLPGVYSLAAHSPEEEVARDFLRSKRPDGVIVVCDATCLQRGVALALQTLEITPRVVIAVNLLDEAAKKGLRLDLKTLKERLGVPVVGVTARRGDGLDDLLKAVNGETAVDPALPRYPPGLEQAIAAIMARAGVDRREALRALDDRSPGVESLLAENGLSAARLEEERAAGPVREAQRLCEGIVAGHPPDRDRKIDRFLTGRLTGVPVMLALLLAVFWITIVGANVPSSWLAAGLFWLEDRLADGLTAVGAADWLTDAVAHGMFRTLAWVVSVMLPPMAIFFPLFTLLEDVGYLPRIAFNLDKHFHRACACGKQALTMCMGFGCNAAGVVGCRIIDSPRERLIAVLTNNFAPCNGRFPALIAVIGMFFVGTGGGWKTSALSAAALTGVIVLGVGATLLISRLLSGTLLKGVPSAFTLELPPYRAPRIGQVIVRSVVDRTLFVLGRAAAVAAPAGLILWILANVSAGGVSLLTHAAAFLDPAARWFGLDGTVLIAFILGFPANEIVFPIIVMGYMAQGHLTELADLSQLRELLVGHGWTGLTAVCVMLFCAMHWPCSTTCLTIRRETGSWRWTALAVALPTLTGLTVCFLVAAVGRLLGFG